MTRAALIGVLCVALAVPVAAAAAPSRPKAPPIAGVTVDGGKRITLSSLRGKPVMINVWSSW
ncbi:MAG: hypothetical protein ACRC50_01490 [Gaiella sp.]